MVTVAKAPFPESGGRSGLAESESGVEDQEWDQRQSSLSQGKDTKQENENRH